MTDSPPLLRLEAVHAGYGAVDVLHGVDLDVRAGECIAVIGSNGAGKSTLLKTVTGQVRARSGRILLDDRPIQANTVVATARSGLRLVPEGRQVFVNLTVEDNLRLGAYRLRMPKGALGERLEAMYAMFPRLKERTRQTAGYLSGGEQQMLAIARALVSSPRILCLDEPSTGLAPIIVDQIFETLHTLRESGLTILLVEQLATKALELADRGYVLELGRITISGPAAELLEDERVEAAYLGGAHRGGDS